MSIPTTVRIASFWRKRPKTGTEDVKVKEYDINIKSHSVPARPFLTIRKENKDRIVAICRHWFFEKT